MLDFRLLDLIADLIVACEPPPKHGPGHPRSAIVRVVATLRRFLREGLPWRSLRAPLEQASCQVAEHCWDPVGHAIVTYGYLFKGLIHASQREV